MNTCLFGRIVDGEVPASVVHEDDLTLAPLDLRQPSTAHVLVLLKRHVETIFDLDPELSAALMRTVILTARAMRASLAPEGLSMWQSNGTAAGQEVPDVHVHLAHPRVGDGLLRIYPDRSLLDQLAATIRGGFDAQI